MTQSSAPGSAKRMALPIILLIGNALLWVVPSDVVELVARDRHTLLGRYSREHFSWIIGTFLTSAVILYVHIAPTAKRRRRTFQVIAVVIGLAPTLVLVDLLLRRPQKQWYVHDSIAYHRLPNDSFNVEFVDLPKASRTYPTQRPGYPPVDCHYMTDARGYRNREIREEYDIVAVGDSFTEGSGVSDEHTWPARLASITDHSVYNLGMSGYAPTNYLSAVETIGLKLAPQLVLCMIYEGNDFRSNEIEVSATEPALGDRIDRYIKQSPIRNAIDDWMIDTLGPVGAKRQLPTLDVLNWLPIAAPEGDSARYYAFAPKQILQASAEVDAFRASPQWRAAKSVLEQMNESCANAGAQLVILFAPTKAHVVLPLARDRLPANDVRSFCALRADSLPPPEKFMQMMFERLPSRETVLREWASEKNIAFVSMTDVLREAAADGTQVYYTYDQHWTPLGHEVVAIAIRAFLENIATHTDVENSAT